MAALADPLLRKLGAVDRREEVTDTYGEQRGHETVHQRRAKIPRRKQALWKYDAWSPKSKECEEQSTLEYDT